MLTKAGAAAVAAGTLLSPREAKAATVEGSGNPGVSGTATIEGGVGVQGYAGPTGYGVGGEGMGSGYAGVIGTNPASDGYGVYGVDAASRGTGVYGYGATGVWGQGRGSGYGGTFEGGLAQLRLTPKNTAGPPTSGKLPHQMGEIYVDSKASIYVCTNGGIPGTWRKVTTASA